MLVEVVAGIRAQAAVEVGLRERARLFPVGARGLGGTMRLPASARALEPMCEGPRLGIELEAAGVLFTLAVRPLPIIGQEAAAPDALTTRHAVVSAADRAW